MNETNEIEARFSASTMQAAQAHKNMARIFEEIGKNLRRVYMRPPRHVALARRVQATQSRIALNSRRHGPGWCE